MSAAAKPVFTVQVRELVEFVCRTGDLGGDGRFAGPDRALAGTLGHQWLQRSRPPEYQKEVRLSHDLESADFILRIQGRLDGVWVEKSGVRLEEIKTAGPGWDGKPDPLHWAQAQCYAYIYAHDHALETISLQLTYLQLETREITEFCEAGTRAGLATFFAATTAVYQRWMQEQFEWRQVRDQSIQRLKFPFAQYRPGQRELAVAAYRALARGERLFLEAPTGIGKTISVFFPAVKALGEGKLERIFYLTATTPGRLVAEQAAADLRRAGLRLRTLTLTARAKLCVQAGQPCDPRTCPLALGYYDRRQPAMRAALACGEITRRVLEVVSREHQVCPYELSLDVSEWVEVVIGDYNYVFDPRVYLRRHFAETGGNFAFLVDEAHNLVDRARAMFSAELAAGELRAVARQIKKAVPRCAKALSRLSAALNKLAGPGAGPAGDDGEPVTGEEADLFSSAPKAAARPARRAAMNDRREETRTIRELPAELLPLLEQALDTAAAWLVKNEPADFREPLLELYFQLHSFLRTAELYDERYVTLLQPGNAARIKLFCVDPSQLLGQALARGRSAVFFSATLTPVDYYRRLLGGAEGDRVLQLASPFPPENLCVLVQDRIRTHYQERANSLGEVVRAIGTLTAERAGNYLVYLPSYQYLTLVVERFQAGYPAVPVLAQRPGMGEAEREAFLAAFAPDRGAVFGLPKHGHTGPPIHRSTDPPSSLVGFAVMGGIFGEGIDLVGDRLIGAVVVGVGLPQLEIERDLIADYFQEQTGAGFDYAYTFPGMNRVLQATGRVIRSETDRGVVLLIDARFREARYRRLFPAGWRPVTAGPAEDLPVLLQRFWEGK
jgi:DNA excision repair protein ERCC-2